MCCFRACRNTLGVLTLLLCGIGLAAVGRGADDPPARRVVLEMKGYLVPARSLSVCPRTAGQVVELFIEEGQRVKKGDVLARLDASEQEAAARLAHAQLKLAETKLNKARESLVKPDIVIAQAEVAVAQARVGVAEQRVASCVIRAPVDGTILARRAEVGSLINPFGYQLPASLCDLADLRAMEIELWVPERDLEKISKGQACTIRVEAIPRLSCRGSVARILPVADRGKGAVGVRVRVDLPPGEERLRPEMGALVQLLEKE
jgi:RND family efflux transporter MFP subunit